MVELIAEVFSVAEEHLPVQLAWISGFDTS